MSKITKKYEVARAAAFSNASIMANDDVDFAMSEMRIANAPDKFSDDYFSARNSDDTAYWRNADAVVAALHSGHYSAAQSKRMK